MKRSFITAVLLISIFSLLLCSSYSIQTDIEDNQAISRIKDTSIIFRISKSSKITKEELINNFLYWLGVHKKNKNITIVSDANDSISSFKNPQERFYQLSNENTYLKYKSIGVINQYLQNNQNELKNIISKNNLDSLIIFELFTIISTEMRFIEFESVLVLVDSNLNIAYLDHQSNNFESENSALNDLKNQIADKINCRLADNLQRLHILGEQTEGERKIAKTVEDKQIKKTPDKPSLKPAEKTADKSKEKAEELNSKSPNSYSKPEVSGATTPPQEIKIKEAPSIEKTAPEK